MRTLRSTTKGLLVAVLALGLLAPAAGAKEAAARTGSWTTKANLTLVHGVPGKGGFPVDISVYRLAVGSQVFNDVKFGTVAGPLKLSPGIYWVGIRAADSPRYSKPILSTWLWLGPGANKSVVAHLKADGTPTVSVYRNDVSATGNKARVTVRHDAAAPAVDVLAGSSPVITNLANPRQATIEVPPGTYPISVAAAGGSPVVFGPADLSLAKHTLTIVYAVGSLSGGSFTPLIQVLPAA